MDRLFFLLFFSNFAINSRDPHGDCWACKLRLPPDGTWGVCLPTLEGITNTYLLPPIHRSRASHLIHAFEKGCPVHARNVLFTIDPSSLHSAAPSWVRRVVLSEHIPRKSWAASQQGCSFRIFRSHDGCVQPIPCSPCAIYCAAVLSLARAGGTDCFDLERSSCKTAIFVSVVFDIIIYIISVSQGGIRTSDSISRLCSSIQS